MQPLDSCIYSSGNTYSGYIDGVLLKEGDYISLNGSTGVVYKGQVETKAAELSGDFAELMDLADK